ncbi:MAG: hypothetical protein LQ346_006624 [Caloplaca aetnensis]|nr:MAG: hypothetical protein LQ346_006624 [Caloplaca aetnensis]
MPFPVDPSDSDPTSFAMPAPQEKINLFPKATAITHSTPISSAPNATPERGRKPWNPGTPDFQPQVSTELDRLYAEHRAVSTLHVKIGAQMDEVKVQVKEIQDRMRNGDGEGRDLDWLAEILLELMHKLQDARLEKDRIVGTIEERYGREALRPLGEVGASGGLLESKEKMRELSEELAAKMSVKTSVQERGEMSDG